jgi:hypothetical protein
MDALADLKARALRAREFTHGIGECQFTLRTPTRTEVREVTRARGLLNFDTDALALPLLRQYLLLSALVGWTGVRVSDVLRAEPAARDPLPWSADAVSLLLDAQPDWADELGGVLLEQLHQRTASVDADAKN